jgi:NSS family neurotransmitter:Na+ symporter
MLLAVFVGWVVKKEDLLDELTNQGSIKFGLFNVWYNIVKFVIPVAVAVIAVAGIISITQTSLMLFGLAVIVVLALFSKKL